VTLYSTLVIASTSNAYLDGPVARIDVRGGISLAKKNYNLTLLVAPHVTSSLPVVATIIGTPIAGALTWVAEKVLSPEVSAITSVEYSVTGSWKKPVIAKVNRAN